MQFSHFFQRSKSLKAIVMAAILSFSFAMNGSVLAESINFATQEVLQNIKGVGPAKAKAIIDERNKNGAFKSPEDLSKRVKGIGSKTIGKLQISGFTFESIDPLEKVKPSRSRSIKE